MNDFSRQRTSVQYLPTMAACLWLAFFASCQQVHAGVVDNFSTAPKLTVYHGSADGFSVHISGAPASASGKALQILWKAHHKSYAQVYYARSLRLPGTTEVSAGKVRLKIYSKTANPIWAVAVRVKDSRGEIFSFQVPASLHVDTWTTVVVPIKSGSQQARWGPDVSGPMVTPLKITGYAFGLNPSMPEGSLWIKSISWSRSGDAEKVDENKKGNRPAVSGAGNRSFMPVEQFLTSPKMTIFHGAADGFSYSVTKSPADAGGKAARLHWADIHKSYVQPYFIKNIGLPHTTTHTQGILKFKIYSNTPNSLWAAGVRIKDNNGEIFSFQKPLSLQVNTWTSVVLPIKSGAQQARWGPGATAPMQGPLAIAGFAFGLNPKMPAGSLWIENVAWRPTGNAHKSPSNAAPNTHRMPKKLPLIASVFTNNMVLQRDHHDPIWGWTSPRGHVAVIFAGKTKRAVADAHGKWVVRLPRLPASSKPAKLSVVTGGKRIVLRNILVGDVWLCSGQSNMEYPMYGWTPGADTRKFIQNANHPTIRLLTIPNKLSAMPAKNIPPTAWVVCTPQSVRSFSAVAYFFGNDLRKKIGVPIGLIAADWGGTPIQPWMPKLAYKGPQFGWDMNQIRQADATFKAEQHAYAKWVQKATLDRSSGQQIPPSPPEPVNPLVSTPEHQMVIFNAMVSPLIPYRLRGIIWYQGESNCYPDAPLYFIRLRALIDSWRQLWNQGNIPFGIVQIAPYAGYGKNLYEPEVWQGEEKVARTVPETGIVGTMDIGTLNNIHPFDKRDVGYRLCLWALAKVYGQKGIVYSGPTLRSVQFSRSRAIIHFHFTDGGLVSRNGKPLNCFQIAGENHKFISASAQIIGNTVVVHARLIKHPVAVRFAWSDAAQPNLMNKAGLPALPFSVDGSLKQ